MKCKFSLHEEYLGLVADVTEDHFIMKSGASVIYIDGPYLSRILSLIMKTRQDEFRRFVEENFIITLGEN